MTLRQTAAKKRILVVEDEELMRSILRKLLEEAGYEVVSADSGETALRLFAESEISVTLTDIKMAGMDGIDLLDQIKTIDSTAMVVIMTAYSSVETAVAALRNGAYDYVTKPFVNDSLLQTVKNAIEHRELFNENRFLRRELSRKSRTPEMIGSSDSLRAVLTKIEKVAPTNSNVLIEGESGTGKELAAKAIHFASRRADKPFLAVNCGALTESLLESELFGHVKGAFTGAVSDKPGLFRSAAGGTLFLDEIAETTPALQIKLLRALQEREVVPVGSSEPVPFDARIISATNKNLEAETKASRFREDLYYRLNVVEITIPPLRERRSDIPTLAGHFAAKFALTQNAPVKSIDDSAVKAMENYAWPGNIRELENTIERAFIMSDGTITAESLPAKIQSRNTEFSDGDARTLESVERNHILTTLRSAGDDKVEAARILGIDLSTLYRKLKKYDEEQITSTEARR